MDYLKYTEESVVDYLRKQTIHNNSLGFMCEMIFNSYRNVESNSLQDIFESYVVTKYKPKSEGGFSGFDSELDSMLDFSIEGLEKLLSGFNSLFNNTPLKDIKIITNYSVHNIQNNKILKKNFVFTLTPNYNPDYSEDILTKYLISDISGESESFDGHVTDFNFNENSLKIMPQDLHLIYRLSYLFKQNNNTSISLQKIYSQLLITTYTYLQENYRLGQNLAINEIITESPKSPTPYIIVDEDFLGYIKLKFGIISDEFKSLTSNIDTSTVIDVDIINDYISKQEVSSETYINMMTKIDYNYFLIPFSEYQRVYDGLYNLYILANPVNDVLFELELNTSENKGDYAFYKYIDVIKSNRKDDVYSDEELDELESINFNPLEDVTDINNYKDLHTYKIFVLGENINKYKNLNNKLSFGINNAEYKDKLNNKSLFIVPKSDVVFEDLALSKELLKLREQLYMSLVLGIN